MTTIDAPFRPGIISLAEDTRWSEQIPDNLQRRTSYWDNETSYFYGLSKIEMIENLKDAVIEAQTEGWDGYGAKRVESSTIKYAFHFLIQLPQNLPIPEICVDNDGEIAFEWVYGSRRVFSVRVGRDGTINYAGIVGHSVFNGAEIFRNNIPDNVIDGAKRVIDFAAS